jgi:uncharacterized protein
MNDTTNSTDNFGSESVPGLSPSPNNPPWNTWMALGIWAASILLILVFTNVFVLPYLLGQNVDLADRGTLSGLMKTDPTAVMLQLSGIIPAHLLTLLLAWLVVTRFRRFSFTEMLGWKMNGFRLWHAFAITIAVYGLSHLAVRIFGEVENDFDIMLKSSRYVVFLVAFFAVFTAPIVEEVVYRGVLFSAIERSGGALAAIVSVTLLFTAVHGLQYSQQAVPDYAVLSVLLILSLILTMIRYMTANLLPCIVLHTVFNAFQSVLMIFEPHLRPILENVPPAAISP